MLDTKQLSSMYQGLPQFLKGHPAHFCPFKAVPMLSHVLLTKPATIVALGNK